MNKRPLKVWFSDFWREFTCEGDDRNPFVKLLQQRFELRLDEHNPDVLFYSCFGEDFRNYSCRRIFVTGESVSPNFGECDFALTYDYVDSDAHYRFLMLAVLQHTSQPHLDDFVGEGVKPRNNPIAQKSGFCAAAIRNPVQPVRNDFVSMLSRYKRVDSGGEFMRNTTELAERQKRYPSVGWGSWVKAKEDWMRNYKFSICFENSSKPGYVTEKLVHGLLTGTVPIYWGSPQIGGDFNEDAFINCHSYDSWEEVLAKVVELDNDDDLWQSYVNAPMLKSADKPQFDGGRMLDALERFLCSPPPVKEGSADE